MLISIYLNTHVVQTTGEIHPRQDLRDPGSYRAGSESYPERRVPESCRADCTITATMAFLIPNTHHGKPMVERTRTSWYIQQKGNLFTTIIGEQGEHVRAELSRIRKCNMKRKPTSHTRRVWLQIPRSLISINLFCEKKGNVPIEQTVDLYTP